MLTSSQKLNESFMQAIIGFDSKKKSFLKNIYLLMQLQFATDKLLIEKHICLHSREKKIIHINRNWNFAHYCFYVIITVNLQQFFSWRNLFLIFVEIIHHEMFKNIAYQLFSFNFSDIYQSKEYLRIQQQLWLGNMLIFVLHWKLPNLITLVEIVTFYINRTIAKSITENFTLKKWMLSH